MMGDLPSWSIGSPPTCEMNWWMLEKGIQTDPIVPIESKVCDKLMTHCL